jgi:hypothetical protein
VAPGEEASAAVPTAPLWASDLRPSLEAADLGHRAQTLQDLQRTVGNTTVQRLLEQPVQRDKPRTVFPPDIIAGDSARKRIEALKREKYVWQVQQGIEELVRTGDHKEADWDERIWMIGVLEIQDAGPTGVKAQLVLWESFGADLLPLAADNLELFKKSYRRGIAFRLEPVKRIREAFERDVKATATDHLSKNAGLVLGEMERIGVTGSAAGSQGPMSDAAPEREVTLAAMQDAAKKTVQADEALTAMLTIPVGYSVRPDGRRVVDTFDPENPPKMPVSGSVLALSHYTDWWITYIPGVDPPPEQPFGDTITMQSYQSVKQTHEALRVQVARFMNDYPAVYAAKQAGKLADLAKAEPRQAQAIVSSVLHEVRANIEKTYPKLRDDGEFWLKLKPIHDQLVKGMVAGGSGTPWTQPLHAFVAKEIVKEHERDEFWKELGLSTLAAAAFLVAELATAGGATFFIAAGVGLGISGAQTYKAWDDYFTLAAAAGSEMSEQTQLVYPGQADAALLGALLQSAFVLLDVGGPARHWVKAARAGLVPELAMKGAAAAEVMGVEGLARRVAAKEITHEQAQQVVERAVAELGVAGTARRAGLEPHALMLYVKEDSQTGRRIAEYVRSPTPAGATGPATMMKRKGYVGKGARKKVPATDDYPDGLVHYDLNAPQARGSYEKSIFHDPDREAGIWMDLASGEHVVVQGNEKFVTIEWMADAQFAGRRWHLMEHFHPTRSADWQLSRYASPEDFDNLLKPYWGHGVEPPGEISSLIRWHDHRTGKPRYTTIGYNGALDQPFWIEFADVRTGKMRRVHLDALTYPQSGVDYRRFLDAEAKSFGIAVDWSTHTGGGVSRPVAVAGAKATEAAGGLVQQLRTLATLEPAKAETLLSRAIEELGPAETLRAADMDWKTLAATLPKPSGAGQKLLYWRDSVLGNEIRQLLPEGDAVRTGTKGSFENDFDWNFMGSNAVENRAKVISYLCGRTGMSPEQLGRLLYADFFTDPRRLFLYERMPPAFRDRIAKRQAELERQLIWNGELSAAIGSGDKALEASVRARMRRLGVPEAKGGVKLLSPEDIRVAEGEIDKLHADFEQAMARKDFARAERRATDIADRQAQINAASGGGYVSYGGVRKFAVEREPELAILLEGEMLRPGWHTAVIDQMPHLRHAVEDLQSAVTKGDMAAAMRGIGKYGDRMTSLANVGLGTEAVGKGAFEELEFEFKLLYARAKASVLDPLSLQSKLATDLQGTITHVKGLLERLERSSEEVLATLQKTADIDVLFEQVQLFTHVHVKFLKAKQATYWQLTAMLKAFQAGKLPEAWQNDGSAW